MWFTSQLDSVLYYFDQASDKQLFLKKRDLLSGDVVVLATVPLFFDIFRVNPEETKLFFILGTVTKGSDYSREYTRYTIDLGTGEVTTAPFILPSWNQTGGPIYADSAHHLSPDGNILAYDYGTIDLHTNIDYPYALPIDQKLQAGPTWSCDGLFIILPTRLSNSLPNDADPTHHFILVYDVQSNAVVKTVLQRDRGDSLTELVSKDCVLLK